MKSVFRCPVISFAILIAAPLGCADPGSPEEARAVAPLLSPYIGQQGRLLLGFQDPDVRSFNFPGVPTTRVDAHGELFGGGLVGQGFTGAKITATGNNTTIDMRIAQVIPPVAPEVEWQYVLEQLDPSSGAWTPACASPLQLVPLPDPPVTPVRAIAMSGTWLPDGLYFLNASAVTFACKTGVVAKCDGWGFPASATEPAVTEHGLPVTVSGPDMLQACTRMARADYCAIGMPNTLDGTPIHIDDIFTAVPDVPGFVFEAAWPGVAVSDRRFLRPPVVCLSKLRWSTLPLGGNCPLVVPDPRVTAKGSFCEDLPPTTLERKGALVYSSSTFLDAGLYTYTDPATDLRLTTASLLPQAVGQLPAWQIAPPAGVNFPVAGQPVVFEATIFAAALPVQIPDTTLVKLSSYRCGSDLITTTVPPSDPSCAQIAVEGYVYPPNTAGRAPLRRWLDPATKHSDTTGAAPSTMIAKKWKLQEVVGGVLRAAIDVNVRWSSLAGFSYTLDVQTRAGEWIPSCIDSAHIAGAAGFTYTGVCIGAANRVVNHADIIAFRVTYTSTTQSLVATQAYDGFSSDAYVALANGNTTAIAVSWNDVGGGATYAFDVHRATGDWIRCADPSLLANDTSYVHTAQCPIAGTAVKVPTITQLRVCVTDRATGKDVVCSETFYDGHSPHVELALPSAQ